MKRYLLLLLLSVPIVVCSQAKKPIVASDLMKIAQANQIQISPDGQRVVMVVTRKAVKNENDYYYTRHLYVADTRGNSEPVQLTFGDKNDNQPQWSPDGTSIAFVRTEGDKSQIWILPMAGGEAYSLTKAEYGATRPRWSPDGQSILYASPIPQYAIEGTAPWGYARPGRSAGDEPNWKMLKEDEKKKVVNSPDGSLSEVRAWLAKNATESNPRVLNRQNLQGELNLQPQRDFIHLFVKSLQPDNKAVQLTSGFQDFSAAEWSPDGKKIICQSRVYKAEPDSERDTDLWTVDVAAKSSKEFLTMPGYSISNPSYAPDGATISFLATPVTNRHATQNQLAVVPSAGGTARVLTAGFDRDVNGAVWARNSQSLYFASEQDGFIPLFSIAASGGNVTRLLGEKGGVNDFDVYDDQVVYAFTETSNPWEVYAGDLKGSPARQVTKLNDWIKDRIVSVPKVSEIRRPDGVKVQYWVMEPVGRKDGTKYPTILNIHGGPSAMWGPGVFSMWHEYQLENSWGYGVVYCNPRGSGGYGDKFKKGNFKNWGAGPAADILASLDDAVKNNAWIDKDQLFVEGGSYAGYMVAWIVGHDHRFKAANAQRGVYDLTTFMGEGNAWRLVPDHFGGYPWDKATKALLDSESPLTYVNNIRTPLLIIHGDQDLRTGVIQSEMLYKSMKILNKPVEYIRYPKEGHELTRSGNPGRMMDHLLRVIEFFERYATHPR